MRNPLFFLLTLFVVFTAASCGDEDDDVAQNQNLIVGNWQAVSGVQTGRTVTSGAGSSTELEFTTSLDNPEDYFLEFTENPNEVTPSGNFSLTTEYRLNGQPSTQVTPVALPFEPATYSISGSTLTAESANGERQEMTIVTLTETDLTLSGEYNITQTVMGFTVVQESDFTYVFEQNN
jgi:hypothetical protein